MPEPESETETASRPVGFRTVYVFDVSQTDGDPLPEFPTVQGNPEISLLRLRTSIENNGIQIIEEVIPGGALGLSTGGTITVLDESQSRQRKEVPRCGSFN